MPVSPTDVRGCEPTDMSNGDVAATSGIDTLIVPTWTKVMVQLSIAIAAIQTRLIFHSSWERFRRRADPAAP
jgi:hypothetical protein